MVTGIWLLVTSSIKLTEPIAIVEGTVMNWQYFGTLRLTVNVVVVFGEMGTDNKQAMTPTVQILPVTAN